MESAVSARARKFQRLPEEEDALVDLAASPWAVRIALFAASLAVCTSVATDLRGRRIPNLVTVPALLVVLASSAAGGGWLRLGNSVAGAAACAAPFLLAAVPRWIGMGDVKLIAVSGAAAGWPGALTVVLFVAVAGGVQAVGQLACARVRGRPEPTHLPYACAIAAGTLAAFLAG